MEPEVSLPQSQVPATCWASSIQSIPPEVKTSSLDFNMHDYSVNYKVSLTLNNEYKYVTNSHCCVI